MNTKNLVLKRFDIGFLRFIFLMILLMKNINIARDKIQQELEMTRQQAESMHVQDQFQELLGRK